MPARIPAAARFEPGTRTIRSVPGNHWLASSDSWDKAIDQDECARIMARAFAVQAAARELLDAYGGHWPDWLAPIAEKLETALTTDHTR